MRPVRPRRLRVPDLRVPDLRVPGLRVPGLRAPGPRATGRRAPGLRDVGMRIAVIALLGACAPHAMAPAAIAQGSGPAAQAAVPAPSAGPSVTSGPVTSSAADRLACTGHAAQGGFVVCHTVPGATLRVEGGVAPARAAAEAGVATTADASGYAVIGFDRDSGPQARIEARGPDFATTLDIAVAPRVYSVQRVDGLPQDTVTPTDPALLARIARERDLKTAAFASRAAGAGFLQTWAWPVDGVISGLWGNQRILNGIPNTPHYGVDIAAPIGTPVRAPADGVVALAEPDMHYEGGLVLIDHGQGLISMYLHMSRLDVKAGDIVRQGDPIGAVGMKGRATGPHLCWRLKWRDRFLDPSLMPPTGVRPLAPAGQPAR
jgi:murein DD-endopeptidase MepM/ murein hydrolase activator NlpD